MRVMLGFVAACLLLACAPSTPPESPAVEYQDGPVIFGDGGPYPDDEGTDESCNRAGRTLWRLGCPAVHPLTGETFPVFCRAHRELIAVDCIAAAKTHDALPECHVRDCEP